VQVDPAPIWLYTCNGTTAQQFKFHTKIDDDGLSCGGVVQFGGPAPPVQVNSYAAFRVTSGIEFNAHCDPNFADDTVDCSDDTDLFVVDRANGAGGYTVRCFKTDADPPPPPPEPGCRAGHICCSGGPPSLCNPGDCAPSPSQCQ
jgi:hypothetical protein